MGVPVVYRKVNQQIIASYDGIDANLGLGYKTYYAFDNASGNYLMGGAIIDSNNKYTDESPTSVNSTLEFDKDFDILFKFPETVEGKLLLNYTLEPLSGGVNVFYYYHTVFIYHVDGAGTETQLATFTEAEKTVLAGGSLTRRILQALDISKTRFAIGEKLRLTFHIYMKYQTAVSNNKVRLWHDPSSRDVAYDTDNMTDFTMSVPFRIQL